MNYWITDAIDEYFYQGSEKDFSPEEIILIIKRFQQMELETGLKVSITDHSNNQK